MREAEKREAPPPETLDEASSGESERRKAKEKAQAEGIRHAGLNDRYYRDMSSEKVLPLPFQARAFGVASEWVSDPERNLIITGSVGTGKTLIAVRAARLLAHQCSFAPRWGGDIFYARAKRIRFISAPIVLDELRRQFGKEKQSDRALENLFVEPSVLFLDDFDKVYPTDWSCERLWLILDARMVKGVPTCITSNLNIDGIDTKYGDAIASRLANNCRLIELDGEDQRVRV